MNIENRTLENLTLRLMVEEMRHIQGQEIREDITGSSALTAKRVRIIKLKI